MSYRHREDEGLPEGYYSRGGRLALNVKIHRGATAEECADVGAENGVTPGEVSGPMENERGGARGVFGGPWGLSWLETFARHRPEHYATFEGWARESAHELAEEQARELFGDRVRLYTDGRSGGWLVVHGGPDADTARESVEAAGSIAGPGVDLAEHEDRRREAWELLGTLEEFRKLVAAAVADFPRAVAWQACANGFQPAAEEYRRACELEQARGRLRDARGDVAFRALGCRNELAELAAGALQEAEARDARELVAVFDRADAELRLARAEVERLESGGGS